MKAIPSQLDHDGDATSRLSTFKCAVIYEDFAAGERAERFYQKLVASMDGDCVSTRNLWSFPVLAIPEMRNIAASAAAVADIVIFALSGRDELPTSVKGWIEMWAWLIEDTQPALVALFESPNGESGSIHAYLRSVTASKHLDFFPNSTFLPLPASMAQSRRKTDTTLSPSEAWQNEAIGACGTP